MTHEYYLETDRKLISSYTGVEYAEIDCIIRCINQLLRLYDKIFPIHYVEIGVLYGGLFKNILRQFHKKINPIGIDLFEDFVPHDGNTHGGNVTKMSLLEEILKQDGFTQFTLLKGDSTQVVPSIPYMEVCCCFIDGNHSYEGCKADFENIYERMDRGFILFHDSQFSEVNQVIDEALTKPDIYNHGKIWSARILGKKI